MIRTNAAQSFNILCRKVSDSCSTVTSLVCVPASGSFFPVETTMVTGTATDSAGNSAQFAFPITCQRCRAARHLLSGGHFCDFDSHHSRCLTGDAGPQRLCAETRVHLSKYKNFLFG
jgi:hypothetical protein